MTQLASSLLALPLLAGLQGCSSARQATQGEIPPPPTLGVQVERIGRPLTANALLGPLASDEESDRLKEEYNRAAPKDWSRFTAEIQRNLAFYDGYDGTCGNQWASRRDTEPAQRYQPLAKLLADDRLWVDSTSAVCTRYLSVEIAELKTPGSPSGDCGGRTPDSDAIDVFRSLLVLGATTGVTDGVNRDDRVHSTTGFPFLGAP